MIKLADSKQLHARKYERHADKRIKKEEKSVPVLERLYFIRIIYKGDTIKEACKSVNVAEPAGYSWL